MSDNAQSEKEKSKSTSKTITFPENLGTWLIIGIAVIALVFLASKVWNKISSGSSTTSPALASTANPTALPSDILDLLRTIAENTKDTSTALWTKDGVPAIDLLKELVEQGKLSQASMDKLVSGFGFDKVVKDSDGNVWFCNGGGQCGGTCYQRVSKEWSCRNGNAVSYNPPQGYTVCCTVNPGNSNPAPIVIQPIPGNNGSNPQGGSATGSGTGSVGDVSGGSSSSSVGNVSGGSAQGGYAQGGSASNGPIDNSSSSGGNTQYAYHGPTEIVIPITIEGSTTNVTINEGDTVIVEGDTYVIVTDGQTGENRRIERPNFCRRLNRLCREGNQNACNLYEDVCVKRVSPTEAASPNPPVEPTDKPDPQPTVPPQCVNIVVTGEVRYVDMTTTRCSVRYAITDCNGNLVAWVIDPSNKLLPYAESRKILQITGCRSTCAVDDHNIIVLENFVEKGSCIPNQPTVRPPDQPTTPPNQPSPTLPRSTPSSTQPPSCEPGQIMFERWTPSNAAKASIGVPEGAIAVVDGWQVSFQQWEGSGGCEVRALGPGYHTLYVREAGVVFFQVCSQEDIDKFVNQRIAAQQQVAPYCKEGGRQQYHTTVVAGSGTPPEGPVVTFNPLCQRHDTGDGGSSGFAQGSTVVGAVIRLSDGRECTNCYYLMAPLDGEVVSGSICPDPGDLRKNGVRPGP